MKYVPFLLFEKLSDVIKTDLNHSYSAEKCIHLNRGVIVELVKIIYFPVIDICH